jgi:SAM-dependent methyltransferase
MDRNGTILAGLDPATARILEVGPSFAPIAPKRAGWRTTVVDHTDRAGLVAKYGVHPGLDIDAIEEVDVTWAGGPLDEAVPAAMHGSFDALIASHVIEHVVDPVAFLHAAGRLLAPHGRILLAVPDLRLCFDVLRPVSTTGQVVAAWREKRQRHAWSAVFDAHAYDARPEDGRPSWPRGFAFAPRLVADLQEVAERLDGYRATGDGPYLDVHGWTFTPASFQLLVLELRALDLSAWQVEQVVEREEVEFLAFLARDPDPPPFGEVLARQRAALLLRRCEEMREQAEWLLGRGADASPRRAVLPLPRRARGGAKADAPARLSAVTDALREMEARLEARR